MVIQLGKVLKEMEAFDSKNRPQPFSLRFVTADFQKGTGGEIIELSGAILAKNQKNTPRYVKNEIIRSEKNTKNPNHWVNGTRNLFHNQRITKVHILLITEFNSKKVVY